jgi:localization factor PodJL
MSAAGAPWSVKGIDPKAREVAKDLARRSGMTLGEWLNQMIMEGDEEDVVTPMPRRSQAWPGGDRRARSRRLDDAYGAEDETDRITRALEILSNRIEAAEQRSTLAVSGVNQAVAGLLARFEDESRDQSDVGHRLGVIENDLRHNAERLQRLERDETAARAAEASKAMETALGKIANQLYEGDARTRAALTEMRDEMADLGRRVERTERGGPDAPMLVDSVVARIAERLEKAEAQTSSAIRALEGSFASLDDRLRAAEGTVTGGEERLRGLAEELSARFQEVRAELVGKVADIADGKVQRMDRALSDLASQVAAAERRSAGAIERMGAEVVRIAENLNGRMTAVQRESEGMARQVSGDVARMADTMEQRLRRMDGAHAEALERLGGEINKISERLAERIAASERRAALAIDDIGERVARAADKIDARSDRTAAELSDRIRQSEERTAKLLEEARARLEERVTEATRRPEPAPTAREAWDEPTYPAQTGFPPAGFPAAPAEGFPATRSFDPLFDDNAGALDDLDDDTVMAPAPQAAPPQPSLAEPAHDLADELASGDSFDDTTEYVYGEPAFKPAAPAMTEAPLTTREAVEAARAAARLGVRADIEDKKGGFSLKLGRKKKPDNTVKKAMLASALAASITGAGVGYYKIFLEPGDAAPSTDDPAATAGAAPMAAVAVAEPLTDEGGSSQAAVDAAALYAEASAKLEKGEDGAVDTLVRAANLGHGPAQFHLAKLYETGDAGLKRDPVEARRWTERAAQAGERRAMHNLGLFYFDGVGGTKNLPLAAQWFRKAAEAGLVDSQYNLGRLYQQGYGVPVDPAEAYRWYLIASRSGDVDARSGAESVRAELSAEQRAAVERAASRFHPRLEESTALASR